MARNGSRPGWQTSVEKEMIEGRLFMLWDYAGVRDVSA